MPCRADGLVQKPNFPLFSIDNIGAGPAFVKIETFTTEVAICPNTFEVRQNEQGTFKVTVI